VLGLVFELLVVEKELLAGGEYKLCAAVAALQNSVDEFHGRLPQRRELVEIGHEHYQLAGPVSLLRAVITTRARAATSSAANRMSVRQAGQI
jgi:hypothetical protein